MHLKQRIANQITQIRKDLGLTQEELADAFNATEPLDVRTTRSDISLYELNAVNPPAYKFYKLLQMHPGLRLLTEKLEAKYVEAE